MAGTSHCDSDTISNLFAWAAEHNEAILRLPSRRQAYSLRNKLHAHRRFLQKKSRVFTGVEQSPYDKFKILLREDLDPITLAPTGRWIVSITLADSIPFELMTRKDASNG